MSFADTLSGLINSIKSGAPHLQSIETALNDVASVVAVAVPAAAPGVDILKEAEGLINAAATGAQAAIAAPAATVASIGSEVGDAATIAASTVASAAQPTEALTARLMALESAFVQLAPIVGSIAKEMGL